VLGQLDLPVLAAGGTGDGRAFAAVLGMGAAGARVGTRFVATHESGAHPAYKQAIAGAAAGALPGAVPPGPARKGAVPGAPGAPRPTAGAHR
jgi:hypothetical protein